MDNLLEYFLFTCDLNVKVCVCVFVYFYVCVFSLSSNGEHNGNIRFGLTTPTVDFKQLRAWPRMLPACTHPNCKVLIPVKY